MERIPLADRVDRLEAENRRLRRWGGAALVLALAVAALGQSAPHGTTVEAQQFVLKDAAGKVRVVQGMIEGASDLSFFDEKGRNRLSLQVMPDGTPRVSLRHADMKSGAKVLLLENGQTALQFFDATGQPRLVASLAADGAPFLQLRDETGKPLFQKP